MTFEDAFADALVQIHPGKPAILVYRTNDDRVVVSVTEGVSLADASLFTIGMLARVIPVLDMRPQTETREKPDETHNSKCEPSHRR